MLAADLAHRRGGHAREVPEQGMLRLRLSARAHTHLDLFIRGVEVSPLLYRLAIVVLELLAIAEATRHREVDQRIEFVQVVLSATRSDTGSDPFEGLVPMIPRCGAPSRDCRPPTSYLAAQL